MDDERMMILNMLQEGKITTDEAARLLDSLKNPQKTSFRPESKVDSSAKNRPNAAPPQEDWTKDIERKIGDIAKKVEPTLKDVTGKVMEKTVEIADKISKSISAPRPAPPSHQAGSHSHTGSSSFGKGGMEKTFEMNVTNTDSELQLTALNGDIFIKGYNGSKISAKIMYQSSGNNDIQLMQLGNRYYLNYDESSFQMVRIECYLPDKMFAKMILESSNGSISIDSMVCHEIGVYTKNGSIHLGHLVFDSLKGETSNGAIGIEDLKGRLLQIENTNGPVNFIAGDIKNITVETSEGEIQFISQVLSAHAVYDWSFNTANAKIKANLPVEYDTGYYVKGYTSLSDVNIRLSSLEYMNNTNHFVEAKTMNYDSAIKKVNILMDTSNAPVVVN